MDGAKTVTGRPAFPWLTILLSAAAGLAFAWPAAAAWLIYDRAAILTGQGWRLWTGHLVHYTPSHLFWNLAVFLPAGAWLERVFPRSARWFLLLAAPAISLVLLLGDTALQHYGGLSGIATGVLVLLALLRWRRNPRDPAWFWPGVLALVVVKAAVESTAHQPLFARFDAGVRPVPLAHLAGIGWAIAAFLLVRWRTGRK